MLNLSRRLTVSVLALCCSEAATVTHPRLRGVLAAAGTGRAAGEKLLEACEFFCATPVRCAHAAFFALRSRRDQGNGLQIAGASPRACGRTLRGRSQQLLEGPHQGVADVDAGVDNTEHDIEHTVPIQNDHHVVHFD